MAFRTKLDYSDNRQIKQRPQSTTVLSGATVFGVPFSALTHGPDLLTTGLTATITGLTSSFSGNSGTTNYTFSNSNMNLGRSGLVPIVPSNTGTTQSTQGFTAKTTTVIDGNTVVLTYSGVGYTILPATFVGLGGGNYSGTVYTSQLKFFSAGTLDFTGRTIWVDVSGLTRTDKLLVNGDATFSNIGSLASAGSLHYTSNGTLTVNTSDARLKTNISPITGALAKVLSLNGVKYNWIEEPNGDKRIGFIAQDVANSVPELVFVNKNSLNDYMGVHYDNVTPLLVEAIKELASGSTIETRKTIINTQTIIAEDNNIELNFNGDVESAVGGGVRVLHAIGTNEGAELKTDENGNWTTNNQFVPKGLVVPSFTPNSSSDIRGIEGNVTGDDDYIYIKTKVGWKRSSLENF